ncbi:hypothetical protein B0J13DRAFT_528211 [Dactylonectria estremocensis]|uniref:Uncharacterized protein n=1 Tax=Dactylonectria estremocensis TaxID=1079267 RepID=A0A9P9EGJ6_9HYPO|nr:hypothetical protein B0J13DRAFT_528211 [Dactylonectria estremocensis]
MEQRWILRWQTYVVPGTAQCPAGRGREGKRTKRGPAWPRQNSKDPLPKPRATCILESSVFKLHAYVVQHDVVLVSKALNDMCQRWPDGSNRPFPLPRRGRGRQPGKRVSGEGRDGRGHRTAREDLPRETTPARRKVPLRVSAAHAVPARHLEKLSSTVPAPSRRDPLFGHGSCRLGTEARPSGHVICESGSHGTVLHTASHSGPRLPRPMGWRRGNRTGAAVTVTVTLGRRGSHTAGFMGYSCFGVAGKRPLPPSAMQDPTNNGLPSALPFY